MAGSTIPWLSTNLRTAGRRRLPPTAIFPVAKPSPDWTKDASSAEPAQKSEVPPRRAADPVRAGPAGSASRRRDDCAAYNCQQRDALRLCLSRPTTGVNIGFSILQYDANSTYRQLILVGLVNTAVLGILGIVLAHIVGLFVAAMAISRNGSLNLVAQGYVELFRNIPLILQALFWYAVVTHLPMPKNAYEPIPGFFLTGRGIFMPGLSVTGEAFASALAVPGGRACLSGLVQGRRPVPQAERRAATDRATGNPFGYGGSVRPGARRWAGSRMRRLSHSPPQRLELPGRLCAATRTHRARHRHRDLWRRLRLGDSARRLSIRPAWTTGGRGGAWVEPLPHFHARASAHGRPRRAADPDQSDVWMFKATTLGIAVGYSDFFYVILDIHHAKPARRSNSSAS